MAPFVPEYRTVSHAGMSEGEYACRRPDSALYQLPFGCMFSAAIAAATFGIAEGAIENYREYMKTRVSTMGMWSARQTRIQQEALGRG